MDAAAALAEEAAIAVFLRPQHRAAGLRVIFDELRRRDAEIFCKAQDLLGADADGLVAAATVARVTGVRERTVTLHVEIDAGDKIAVGHDIAS